MTETPQDPQPEPEVNRTMNMRGGVADPVTGDQRAAAIFAQRRAEAIAKDLEPAEPGESGESPTPTTPADTPPSQAATPKAEPPQQTPSEPATEEPSGTEDPVGWDQLSGPAQERFRKLARERNELLKGQEQTQAQMKMLMEMVQRQQAAGANPQQAAQGTAEALAPVEFNEPFPEDGSLEEQAEWKQAKHAFEASQRATQGEIKRFIYALAPHLQQVYTIQQEKEWQDVPLKKWGLTREEVEPAIERIRQQRPGTSIKAAFFEALAESGVDVPMRTQAPTPPQVQQPGAGRQVPPGQAPQATTEDKEAAKRRELRQQIANAGWAGDHQSAGNALAEYFKGLPIIDR